MNIYQPKDKKKHIQIEFHSGIRKKRGIGDLWVTTYDVHYDVTYALAHKNTYAHKFIALILLKNVKKY